MNIVRNFRVAALCAFAVAGGATAQSYDSVVSQVTERVNARDCAGALAGLQAGLAENRPAVALLAGTMYERGVCLKPDWDTAVGHYIVAHDGGEKAAAYRLAAGYAAPMGGPDPAAALWWFGKSASGVKWLGTCAVPPADRIDPDRFVAVLQTWAPARIAGCNYVTGLIATLSAEIQFSREIRRARQAGTLHARILPALGTIDVWTAVDSGVFSAAEAPETAFMRRAARPSSLENVIRKMADAALARYPQPPGLDPAWTQTVQITYGQDW